MPPAPSFNAAKPMDYRGHYAATVRLAGPIIISRAGLVVLFTVDSLMAARAGGLELAGLGLGTAPLLTVMLVCLGALQSAVVLASQAIGQGNNREVGHIFRAANANAVALGLGVALLSLFAEDFFLAIGQEPQLSRIAADVSLEFAWGLPGQLLFLNAFLILEAMGYPRVGMVVMFAANLLNIVLDGVYVLGWGDLVTTGGAATAIATSSLVRWVTALVALAVVFRIDARLGHRYGISASWQEFTRSILTMGGAPGRAIRRMGLPMGLGQGVESAAFATFTLLAGLLGAVPLAAHQATMTAMMLVYMNAVGIGGAASIRVGQADGARAGVDLRRAGIAAVVLGGLFSGVWGILIALMPGWVASLIVEESDVIAIATGTLFLAGLIMAFDSMMGVSMGALRGLGDVWAPLWMQAAAYWVVGVPVAWVTALKLEMGAIGLFIGIGAGTIVSLGLLFPRFLKVSARLAKQSPDR